MGMNTNPLNKAFGRATAIPRGLNIIPESTKTPQGAVDYARGKEKKKKKKSVLSSDNQTSSRGGALS